MIRLASILLALALAAPAYAADVNVGNLTISTPWTRATPKGAQVGVGYLIITNKGNASDRLIGGTTEAANRLEIHEMTMDNGVMRMRPVAQGLEIKPGATVALKPGGDHVMFVGLKSQLAQGQQLKATLAFEKAGKVEVDFAVESIGAMNASAGDHAMPGMSGMQHGH